MNEETEIKRIKNLKKAVEKILERDEASRNSDQRLTILIWIEYYPTRIKVIDERKYIALRDVMLMPREDNVKRIRAKIQNEEHKFLPTDEKVREARGILEEVWLKYCREN